MENTKDNSEKIWKLWKKDKLNSEKIWKIQKKIVKWYGKYGWNVKWYGKYGRKVSWKVIPKDFPSSLPENISLHLKMNGHKNKLVNISQQHVSEGQRFKQIKYVPFLLQITI
jgi:hypothetical protein